jgi:hypothetical protein
LLMSAIPAAANPARRARAAISSGEKTPLSSEKYERTPRGMIVSFEGLILYKCIV